MLAETWVTDRKSLRFDIFQKAQKIPLISLIVIFITLLYFKKGDAVLLCANTTDLNPDWSIKNTFITVGSGRTLMSQTYSNTSKYKGTFRQKSDFTSASHGTLIFQPFLLPGLTLANSWSPWTGANCSHLSQWLLLSRNTPISIPVSLLRCSTISSSSSFFWH